MFIDTVTSVAAKEKRVNDTTSFELGVVYIHFGADYLRFLLNYLDCNNSIVIVIIYLERSLEIVQIALNDSDIGKRQTVDSGPSSCQGLFFVV